MQIPTRAMLLSTITALAWLVVSPAPLRAQWDIKEFQVLNVRVCRNTGAQRMF